MAKTDDKSFEAGIDAVTQIIEQMESGKATLEESMQLYEQGSTLIKACQKQLADAEQKVKILSAQDTLDDFKTDETA